MVSLGRQLPFFELFSLAIYTPSSTSWHHDIIAMNSSYSHPECTPITSPMFVRKPYSWLLEVTQMKRPTAKLPNSQHISRLLFHRRFLLGRRRRRRVRGAPGREAAAHARARGGME